MGHRWYEAPTVGRGNLAALERATADRSLNPGFESVEEYALLL